ERLNQEHMDTQIHLEELEKQDKALLKGTLVEANEAPYLHDKANTASYYVKLKNEQGEEQEIWGVDLKRALEENNAEIGTRIGIANDGHEPLVINDDKGEEIEVKRNLWRIENEKELETSESE